jgi:hypothetical protein
MQTNIYKINVTRLQYKDVSAQYYFDTLIVYYTATFVLLIF